MHMDPEQTHAAIFFLFFTSNEFQLYLNKTLAITFTFKEFKSNYETSLERCVCFIYGIGQVT